MIKKTEGFFSAFKDQSKEYLDTFDQLNHSKINFGIAFWDEGFKTWLGDESNGILETKYFGTIREAVAWLTIKAVEHFPDSEFAQYFRVINPIGECDEIKKSSRKRIANRKYCKKA